MIDINPVHQYKIKLKQSIPECVYVIVYLVKILKKKGRENKLRRIGLIKK